MLGRKSTDFITVKDVPAHDFIVAYAQHLKKNNTISAPDVSPQLSDPRIWNSGRPPPTSSWPLTTQTGGSSEQVSTDLGVD